MNGIPEGAIPAEAISHHFSTPNSEGWGTYAKEYRLKAGEEAVTHRHRFNHLSILAQGEVVVTAGKVAYPLRGPAAIEIVAGVEHSIRAVTTAVWYCIHATKETDAEKIDHELIKPE